MLSKLIFELCFIRVQTAFFVTTFYSNRTEYFSRSLYKIKWKGTTHLQLTPSLICHKSYIFSTIPRKFSCKIDTLLQQLQTQSNSFLMPQLNVLFSDEEIPLGKLQKNKLFWCCAEGLVPVNFQIQTIFPDTKINSAGHTENIKQN
jgi:hypothetical protein